MNEEYTVFKGSFKTVEWFFNDNNKGQSLEYFSRLPLQERNIFMRYVMLLGENEHVFDVAKFRHEGCQIYAIKIRQHRFYCFFFMGGKIIITNGYTKKSRKGSLIEREKACKARKNYSVRVMEGRYYDKT